VIPIEESLIYVQPVYLKAESGQIPELKRVVVAYENLIAMEETLDKALGRIFGQAIKKAGEGKPPEIKEVRTEGVKPLTDLAWQHLQKARQSLREENWSAFGQSLRDLEQALKQMREGNK
jgi:uncharacterized membrane protein (UPF0182 family)